MKGQRAKSSYYRKPSSPVITKNIKQSLFELIQNGANIIKQNKVKTIQNPSNNQIQLKLENPIEQKQISNGISKIYSNSIKIKTKTQVKPKKQIKCPFDKKQQQKIIQTPTLPSNRFDQYLLQREKIICQSDQKSEQYKIKSEDMYYSETENSQFRVTGNSESPFRRTTGFEQNIKINQYLCSVEKSNPKQINEILIKSNQLERYINQFENLVQQSSENNYVSKSNDKKKVHNMKNNNQDSDIVGTTLQRNHRILVSRQGNRKAQQTNQEKQQNINDNEVRKDNNELNTQEYQNENKNTHHSFEKYENDVDDIKYQESLNSFFPSQNEQQSCSNEDHVQNSQKDNSISNNDLKSQIISQHQNNIQSQKLIQINDNLQTLGESSQVVDSFQLSKTLQKHSQYSQNSHQYVPSQIEDNDFNKQNELNFKPKKNFQKKNDIILQKVSSSKKVKKSIESSEVQQNHLTLSAMPKLQQSEDSVKQNAQISVFESFNPNEIDKYHDKFNQNLQKNQMNIQNQQINSFHIDQVKEDISNYDIKSIQSVNSYESIVENKQQSDITLQSNYIKTQIIETNFKKQQKNVKQINIAGLDEIESNYCNTQNLEYLKKDFSVEQQQQNQQNNSNSTSQQNNKTTYVKNDDSLEEFIGEDLEDNRNLDQIINTLENQYFDQKYTEKQKNNNINIKNQNQIIYEEQDEETDSPFQKIKKFKIPKYENDILSQIKDNSLIHENKYQFSLQKIDEVDFIEQQQKAKTDLANPQNQDSASEIKLDQQQIQSQNTNEDQQEIISDLISDTQKYSDGFDDYQDDIINNIDSTKKLITNSVFENDQEIKQDSIINEVKHKEINDIQNQNNNQENFQYRNLNKFIQSSSQDQNMCIQMLDEKYQSYDISKKLEQSEVKISNQNSNLQNENIDVKIQESYHSIDQSILQKGQNLNEKQMVQEIIEPQQTQTPFQKTQLIQPNVKLELDPEKRIKTPDFCDTYNPQLFLIQNNQEFMIESVDAKFNLEQSLIKKDNTISNQFEKDIISIVKFQIDSQDLTDQDTNTKKQSRDQKPILKPYEKNQYSRSKQQQNNIGNQISKAQTQQIQKQVQSYLTKLIDNLQFNQSNN